jgi:cholesterol transport system auxiliary component
MSLVPNAARRVAPLLLLPWLAACGSLLDSDAPPDTVYELRTTNAPKSAAALAPQVPGEIVVLRPLVRPGLETDRIVVALPDHRLDSYRGSRWSASLPDLVQSLLLDDLRARGAWQTVLPDRGEFRGRWMLQTEIRDFQAEYATPGTAPLVRVTLRGELGRAPSRGPVGSAIGAAEVRAASDRMRDVAAAFAAAYAEAADRLLAEAHARAVEVEAAVAASGARTDAGPPAGAAPSSR